MSAAPNHRVILARGFRVPPPFRQFAVRSEEPRHADRARPPCAQVHLLRPPGLDSGLLGRLAAQARSRVTLEDFPDIAHARTTVQELAALAPTSDLPGQLAAALQLTGVLGPDRAAYRRALGRRIDYLGGCGAGFHNDVGHHWPACLFWLLVLEVDDVEFVMPHAGLQVPLAPGDLLVFDQTLAHGLCRPADGGQATAASFDPDVPGHCQYFLTGELPLEDRHWAALGLPWRGVELHQDLGALDLMVAEFDACSGAIKRLREMTGCMRRHGG